MGEVYPMVTMSLSEDILFALIYNASVRQDRPKSGKTPERRDDMYPGDTVQDGRSLPRREEPQSLQAFQVSH